MDKVRSSSAKSLLERCESGRIGLTANELTVSTGPRVQIPPSPLHGRSDAGRTPVHPASGVMCRGDVMQEGAVRAPRLEES